MSQDIATRIRALAPELEQPETLPGDHAAFVCVEAAEVRPVPVAPGATWRGTQAIFAARTRTR